MGKIVTFFRMSNGTMIEILLEEPDLTLDEARMMATRKIMDFLGDDYDPLDCVIQSIQPNYSNCTCEECNI